MENLDQYWEQLISLAIAYGPRLLLAIITLVIGLKLIKWVMRLLGSSMTRREVDQTLRGFLESLTSIGLKFLLLITVAAMVGVETTSFIALLGAAGLAVGLALQGSLANFAGGVLILFFKPFKVGDIIDAQGYLGTVDHIQIFNTILRTLDNERVIIPNGILSNGCIKNVFAEETRRVDLTFGVSYSDDIARVREVLEGLIAADERILKDPPHDIFLGEHGASSINFFVRLWVVSDDYWPVHFDMLEKTKIAFDEASISIPFPQRDVHLVQAAE